MEKQFLTIEEVMQITGQSRTTIWRRTKDGSYKTLIHAGRPLYHVSQFKEGSEADGRSN